MLLKSLAKGHDKGRLKKLLALFFLALAIPTAILIWHAYGQLKWEAFHQYRVLAEELTRRIDARLTRTVNDADAQSFADYSFLVVTGDPGVNFLQRSQLAAYPVAAEPPGLVGYFQVDTGGAFSSPLLPSEVSDPGKLGIGQAEYAERLLLAQKIQGILADNRLVPAGPQAGLNRVLADVPAAPAAALEEDRESDEAYRAPSRERRSVTGAVSRADAAKDRFAEEAARSREYYSQEVFDQLNRPGKKTQSTAALGGLRDADDAIAEPGERQQQGGALGKVSDLKLDSVYQQKSEEHESLSSTPPVESPARESIPARAKRKEQTSLAETVGAEAEEPVDRPSDLRIRTFESEIDPFEFSMLDSGHFVLFRKVWRGGERYIQGLLIDQQAFTRGVIERPFMETALSGISRLIVAHGEDVIHTVSGCDANDCPGDGTGMDGSLVFRKRLSAPLDGLELIFSVERLPPGPGARVLAWVTLVLALVFLSGFYTLYRLGLGQIRLARQQQDFVSAVSHELKTPLTSIRMYGEMLKEGWVDEEKKHSYYEFIHDESERLTRLISNVLQLANITRNDPQFELKPVAVAELMSNMESKIASQAERAGFSLGFKRDNESAQARVMIDQDCFAQIVINLVDNAIKFSSDSDNRAIEIASKVTADGQVRFSVRDFGPGIPKSQMKKIFQLFYRPESELTRETVGTGIGLAIVHQLTLAMNGRVDVVNRDVGAEFTVSFPVIRT